MKRCLAEVVGPLAALAITVLSLEMGFAGYRSWIDVRFDVFEGRQSNTRVLIVGNSHMGALGEPLLAAPGGVFNFSIGGLDLFHIAAIINFAIRTSTDLRVVFLGLDYELLGYNLIVGNQLWKDRLLARHVGLLYDDNLTNRLKARSNFFRANRDFSYVFDGGRLRGDGVGGGSGVLSRPVVARDCEDRALEHSRVKFDETLEKENSAYLREIVGNLRDVGVRLVAVNLPKRPCYVAAYDEEAAELARQRYAQLGQEGLFFLDWFDHPAFGDDDFIDSDHLGPKGIEKITTLLSEVLGATPYANSSESRPDTP